jgi:hypothetical protein
MFAPTIKFEKEFWFFLLQYEVVHCWLQISILFLSICDQWEDKGMVAIGISQIQEKYMVFLLGMCTNYQYGIFACFLMFL